MSVLTKEVPYGAEVLVTVIDVIDAKDRMALICDDGTEGYICMYERGAVSAKIGEKGKLTFTKGGPTGGYWAYESMPEQSQDATAASNA